VLSERNAQEWFSPRAICDAVERLLTETGELLEVLEEFPSWP